MQIEPGAQARAVHVVTEADTALAVGTGAVPVLATSRALAWCERATFDAIQPAVPEGSTSVAMRVQIDHLKAASIDCEMTAIATLERVEGRRFVFVVSLLDDTDEISASGRIVRVLVDTATFVSRACGTP